MRRSLDILHNNGVGRCLHFLMGRGDAGVHISIIAENCDLSLTTTRAYLSSIRRGVFNPSTAPILHRHGWAYKGPDFRPLVETVPYTGFYRITDAGREFYGQLRFGWDWR